MKNKYTFLVGQTCFSIHSDYPLDFPLSYTKFFVENKNKELDFEVKLYFLSRYDIPKGEVLVEQRTYKWIKVGDTIYYVFSKRSTELKDDKAPWVLVIKGDKCELHIPSICCSFEIFDRPWLHRLFSYYLSDDSVLVHGGCVLIDGGACLILGECGKGKSTFINIATRCGMKSICDDRFMLKFINNNVICYSTPWNQKNPNLLTNDSCLVNGICFLEHSKNNINSLEEFSISEKRKDIVSQFYLPIPKSQLTYLVLFNKKVSNLNIKVWEYAFLPNEGAINEFSNEFKKYCGYKRSDQTT